MATMRVLTEAEAAEMDVERVEPGMHVGLDGKQQVVGAVLRKDHNGHVEWVLSLGEVSDGVSGP